MADLDAQPWERACAVCSRILDRIEDRDGVDHWTHIRPQDHPAVPVELGELASIDRRCDFCSARGPTWVFPAEDFADPEHPQIRSASDWLACDACHGLLEAGKLSRLAQRAARAIVSQGGLPADAERDTRAHLLTMYRALARHRTGDPARLA